MSRKIDAQIAKKVFKLKVSKQPGTFCEQLMIPVKGPWSGEWRDDLLPKYSEDMKHAWEVAKKVQKKGWNIDISYNGYCSVQIVAPGGSSGHGIVMGHAEEKSAPLAICKAALQTIEAEEYENGKNEE